MAHENATPRPWTFDDNSGWQPWSGAVEICQSPGWTIGWMCSGEEASANAGLIVEAVNAYDTLRAENERLAEENARLTRNNEMWRSQVCNQASQIEALRDQVAALSEAQP